MSEYVVGLGEILWDVFPTGTKLGGAPANFAFHVSQFGLDGLAVSAVGRDTLGEETVEELYRNGLHFHLDRVEEPTGTVQVTLDGQGVPSYEIKTGVAWDNIPYTKELAEIAASTRAVCFGSLAQRSPVSRETIGWFLDAVPEDCLKVFDINLRQSYFTKATIRESLHRADILKLNEEELYVLTNLFDYKLAGEEVLCRRIMKAYNLRMIILTKGIHGSWVLWKDGKSYQGTPKVKVKSAVGAGDAFTGAFIGSYLNGATIQEAHEMAVKVSAYVCTQKGAMPPVPEDIKL